ERGEEACTGGAGYPAPAMLDKLAGTGRPAPLTSGRSCLARISQRRLRSRRLGARGLSRLVRRVVRVELVGVVVLRRSVRRVVRVERVGALIVGARAPSVLGHRDLHLAQDFGEDEVGFLAPLTLGSRRRAFPRMVPGRSWEKTAATDTLAEAR